MYKLDNWSVGTTGEDEYMPPELLDPCLAGTVYDHPDFEDGESIVTSPIREVHGRVIKTQSGSLYKLGRINPEYRKWLKENYPDWDPKHPIRMVE
ncbi:MAG TPA: hypothetical protein PKD55_01350 [Bellilinea sp.]|nr:hypothetical protein [Bellilinea sp.]